MEDIYIDLRKENRFIREAFDYLDFVSVSDILDKVEDLSDKLSYVEEEYEDFKRDVEDNYKKIPVAEQLDISDRDFI